MKAKLLHQSRRYKLAPGVNAKTDDDGVTLFDSHRGRYWRGNSTAQKVVDMLSNDAINVQNIVDAMKEEVDEIEEERIVYDVSMLLSQLLKAKLVRKVG